MADWPVHPAAALFPMLPEDELAELADDIAEQGLLEPVWLWNDGDTEWLLDGRNRVAACGLSGMPVETRSYRGDDPIGFVLSLNVKRRHLTVGQKAAIALEVLPLYEAEAAKRKLAGVALDNLGADLHQGPERAPRAADKAAGSVGVSGRAVAQAKRVAEAAPDLLDKVRDGSVSIDKADRIVRNRNAGLPDDAPGPKTQAALERLDQANKTLEELRARNNTPEAKEARDQAIKQSGFDDLEDITKRIVAITRTASGIKKTSKPDNVRRNLQDIRDHLTIIERNIT